MRWCCKRPSTVASDAPGQSEATRGALKQLKKLGDKPAQARIPSVTAELARLPDLANIKAPTNHQYGYRLRVGDYRVFFIVAARIQVVLIEEVKKRDERTY